MPSGVWQEFLPGSDTKKLILIPPKCRWPKSPLSVRLKGLSKAPLPSPTNKLYRHFRCGPPPKKPPASAKTTSCSPLIKGPLKSPNPVNYHLGQSIMTNTIVNLLTSISGTLPASLKRPVLSEDIFPTLPTTNPGK